MELTAYRERFPILAETNYLISHSLGPMPAETENRLAEYAHAWKHAWHPSLGRGLVGHVDDRRRPGRPADRRAAWFDGHAPERDDRRGGRPVVLRLSRRAPQDRVRGGELPLGPLPAAGAAGTRRRGRRLPERGGDRRGDRRAHAARPDQPCDLQDRPHPGRRADHRARTRGRRVRGARRVSVRRHGSSRRHRAERRLRRRRERQVALRRSRGRPGSTSVPISTSGSSRRSSAGRPTRGPSTSRPSSSTPRAPPVS